MKKKYSTPNLIKVVSLSTVMATLLSSVSPVFAANLSITGVKVNSSNMPQVEYPHGSHGSVVFAGDDDFCGADNVIGRGGKQQQGVADSQRITAQEQYERFVGEKVFGGRSPYGTTTGQVIWAGDGYTTSTDGRVLGGYMGALTRGTTSAMPEAYGVYSFATGCGSAATGNYSTVFGAGATAKAGGAQAFGVSALASGKASVAMGVGSEASGESTVAIGGLATASGKNSISIGVRSQATLDDAIAFGSDATASGINSVAIGKVASASGYDSIALGLKTKATDEYAVAIGTKAEAQALGSIAIGGGEPADNGEERKVIAKGKNSIAIGTHTYAETAHSVAIGINAQVRVIDGVAVGGGSVSRVESGVFGYDPVTNTTTTKSDLVWKSTGGDFSVGNTNQNLTRQITNVAAGSEDTDAVNVAQLKAMRDVIAGGGAWKLSTNDTDPTEVNAGNTVDFSVKDTEVGKDNLKIEKDSANNKHKIQFTLSDTLKLTSVTTGKSTMSDDGFVIKDGPRMTVDGFFINSNNGPNVTVDGIDAGNQKIINVAEGTEDTDAVNYKQLKAIEKATKTSWQLAVNGGDATAIGPNGTVNFQSADNKGTKNIKIEKDDDHNVTFDLADNINVMSVTAGESIMSAVGFKFIDGNGPSMTVDGIDAGRTNIRNMLDATEDDEAVTYGQLKEVKTLAEKGWKLSVDGTRATDVKAGSTVDLVAGESGDGSKNIKIVKSDDNKVTFTLNDNLTLTSVTTGNSIMNGDGFKFVNGGPSVTANGINAGNEKITKVKAGTEDTDAVNFLQLKEIKDQIAGNSLVQWDEGQKLITIGKEKGGTKIDITGNEGDRIIAGVKDAVNGNEAVNKKQLDESIEKISKDALLWDEDEQAFVASREKEGSKADYRITHILDGDVNEESTDAINGSQLYSMGSKIAKHFGGNASFENGVFTGPKYELTTIAEDGAVSIGEYADVGSALDVVNKNVFAVDHRITTGFLDIAEYFGGGAKYEKGKWTAPTFKVSQRGENGNIVEKEHHNVADALGDVNTSITDIYSQINNVTENSLVKWDEGEKLITIGKEKGGAKIDITGSGGSRTIAGVKAAENDDEAVNKKQLDDTVININNNVINQMDKFAVLYDKNDDNSINYNSVTLGGNRANGQVALHNVKDGKISDQSHDAINGSQINKISQNVAEFFGGGTSFENGIFRKPRYNLTTIDEKGQVKQKEHNDVGSALSGLDTNIRHVNHHLDLSMKDVASYFGGGAGYNENGEWHAPTFQVYHIGDNGAVSKQPYSNVADAFEGVNNTFTNIHNQISDITKNSLVKQENESAPITIGKETGGTEINIANKNNQERTLSGIKDGSIDENSHDAINGSQINKISADIAKFFGGGAKFINGAFEGLKYTLSAIVDGKVGQANFYDVGSALTGLDNNVKDVNQRLTNVSNEFNQQIENFSKDALLWDDEEEAFVARHEKDGQKTKSKLKYLLDGEIAKGSTDAITGNQLYFMSNQLANYFGGGAKYENGKWTDPTFKIVQVNADGTTVEKEHHNVADAFGDINNGMSNINDRIDDVINKVDSDALKWNDKEKAYDAGRDGKPNKIINVADGKIEKGSKDAVNGGQLWETNERVTGVEKDVKHLNNRVDNISNTIADIGDTVINIDAKVDNINNRVDVIAEDAVRYDRDENGKKTNKITLAGGDASEPVLIDNVADGKIEKGSKEAVNGGQLHDYTQEQMKIILDESKHYTDQRVNNIVIDAIDDAVDRSKQYTDMKFDVLNYSIESVKKEARQAAAIGLAVSNLRYNDTPGKLSVGFGTGLWRSQSAFAFGAGYTSENGKYRSNISATTSGGHWGVGAGFNMTLN
ncbi:Vomp family autotransporter [Bartonella sp. AU18XJBT]|uniref:Vomp family autotransporter n=1 Tax=Bartonella sp. AU18XJBT TaxID=3019089 RepID=UPI00235E87C6|nr:Vomp family autotransporter [Bartonella sp. AU18XJBT]